MDNAYEVFRKESEEDLTREKLLILNPGSTSTKIAYYEDEQQIFVESISHSADEIAKYDLIVDQYEFRKDRSWKF